MKTLTQKLAFVFLVSVAILTVIRPALAWEPTKPITVIFPNGPGAGNEISYRIVAQQIEQKNSKFKWVPDYRPGADGNIAMNHFNTVPADGYTIAVPACQSGWVTPDVWYPKIAKYNAQDFEPIGNIARSPLAFWARANSPINTPEELIEAIKNKKRPMMFAIGGAGHKLAVEYLTTHLAVAGGDRVETIMYKGPAQALADVLGGHVEFGVTPVAVGHPLLATGKIKLIALANAEPIKGLESVPLMKNYVPGLNIHGCWNIVLPKGTPADVQAWYRANFIPALLSKESAAKFEENFMFTTKNEHTPEGVRASMAKLQRVWQPIAAKIKPE